MDKRSINTLGIRVVAAASLLLLAASPALGQSGSKTYTVDADFDEGTLINVNHDTPNNNQLQLNDSGEPFNFIWVAASGRGTIVKIDTVTGAILGEYKSAPNGRARNPSRTTVDANGNVWAGNRNEAADGQGSVVHIGLVENGQCEDRNGNGTIETSSGLGIILDWTNAGGADDGGGVSTALDECIIHYVRTSGTNVRTVAVDGSNNVWIGGYGNRVHELYDQDGVAVPGTQFNVGCGGYGGLVDGNGVLWSANIGQSRLLRYDTGTSTGACIPISYSYGLGIDTNGFIWNSMWSNNSIVKISSAGAIQTGFPAPTGGASNDRGVAVTPADNNVWVANSGGTNVSRLDNNGNVLTIISVGSMPTGVAVDAAGKVWVTNHNSHNVMRIDPATNTVDLTVNLGGGAYPYNYSDMTGSTLTAPPDNGTWKVDYDSGQVNAPWKSVSWNALEPGDSSIVVTVAGSDDGITFGLFEPVTNGGEPTFDAQYLRINVAFTRATAGDSPILYDLTAVWNLDPDCSAAVPSIDTIWPPNHKFVAVDVLGVTDPDGDAFTINIDSIWQDEPVDTLGDGTFAPDGQGVGTATAEVRAERTGDVNIPGNGRVYHIGFTATDVYGGSCSGSLAVGVPHDVQDTPVDDGALYDSTTF
jgi:streptogramin lyase